MRLILTLLLLATLAGCSTPTTPERRPGPSATSAASTAALAAEQRRLADLFRGTPVVFAMQADGSLRVEVPLRYCFDAGQASVKPPLAAVLDRVARSQRDTPTRLHVSAPTDPGARGLALATRRAVGTREYMVERGVAATRFSVASVGSGGVVRIVVGDASVL